MPSQKYPKVVTPKGVAIWPKLNEPDTKFHPEGVYSVKLRLSSEDADKLIEDLNSVYSEAYMQECSRQGKKAIKKSPMPWADSTDWDSEAEAKVEVPGFVDFKFSMKAKVTAKSGKSWEQRPALFDSKLHPMPVTDDGDRVGGGSVIRISAEVYSWFSPSLGFGISLRPRAVQVIDMKAYSPGSSGDHGFDSEDGFTVDSPFEDSASAPNF